jgi:bacteriocin biosynthesis cyclodehydratase domain-containing protein
MSNATPIDVSQLQAPYLKPWWRVTYEATCVTFHYGEQLVSCHGRAAIVLFPTLLPLLDGRHALDEVVGALGPVAAPAIRKALELLASRDLLIDGPSIADEIPAPVRDTVHFMAATRRMTRPMPADADRLTRLRVGVVGSSGTAREIARSLKAVGAKAHALAWTVPAQAIAACDLVVVAPSAAELPLLLDWNGRALRENTHWLQVLPHDGRFASVGPLYVPGETCCYECFCYRRASNVEYASEFWAMQTTAAPYPSTLPLELMLAGLVTLAVLRWHLRADEALPGQFQALEIGSDVTLSTHLVYRVPRCTACSTVGTVAPPLPWFEATA